MATGDNHKDATAAALRRAYGLLQADHGAVAAVPVLDAYEQLKARLEAIGVEQVERGLREVSEALAELQRLQATVDKLRALRARVRGA